MKILTMLALIVLATGQMNGQSPLSGSIRQDLLRIEESKTSTTRHPFPPLKNYQLTWKKGGLWTLSFLAGVAQGMGEAKQAEPTVYERKFKVSKYSFFGSHSWERCYVGNRYQNTYLADLGPTPNKHRSELLGNFGYDDHHTLRITNVALTATVGLGIGTDYKKGKLGHTLLDCLIGAAVHSLGSTIAYNYLRS